MKKTILLLLCFSLLFSLSACAGLDTPASPNAPEEVSPTVTPTAEQTAAPEPTPAELTLPEEHSDGADLGDQTLVYLTTTREEEDVPDEDHALILTFTYVTPKVRMDKNAAVADMINEKLALLDEVYYSGSDTEYGKNYLYQLALDHYSYAMEKGTTTEIVFSSYRDAHVCRADGSVISFLYWKSVYIGGPQSEHSYVGHTYSSETGEELSLSSLSPDAAELKKDLSELLVSSVKENADQYDAITLSEQVKDSAIAALVRDGNWYFSGEGMVFFPAFGELTEDDQGFDMYTIPYEKLVGVIDDKFLAGARENGGELTVLRVSDVEDGTIKSIDRLSVSDGDEMYLKVDGTIYDVAVSSVNYFDQAEGERFFETERYWYASFMTDCALQICAQLPEGMPNLMISYTDENYQVHRLLLSENGIDGTPVLVDDSIVAVG